jgi:Tol biopolymer transport system component
VYGDSRRLRARWLPSIREGADVRTIDLASLILLFNVLASGSAAAQRVKADPGPLPPNVILPAILEPLVAKMGRQSLTFRRQCARLAEHPEVTVTIDFNVKIPDTAGARSLISRRDDRLSAAIHLDVRRPERFIENIAHELEHVLERIDGTNLPWMWRQRVEGIVNERGGYETARASAVGRMVARGADASSARALARQRIRAHAAGTLKPAALDDEGRLIAFVSQRAGTSMDVCCRNVYVIDRTTGLITQESLSDDASSLRGDSDAPSLSADGRMIAFETVARSPLADPHKISRRRIIVRDRQNGRLRTPSSARGLEPDGDTGEPALSGNGQVVAFTSDAMNLVPGGDANGDQTDIYLWHLEDSTIARVSVDSDGVQPVSGASYSATVSRDGTWVAFVSTARLADEDTNDLPDVYLRDVTRGRTFLVSRGLDGGPANGVSHSPALSADGRYVAFVSMATNLAPRDRNHDTDVFVHDIATGVTTLVSATADGDTANAGSRAPRLSADGRLIVFQSAASNLGSRRGGRGCAHPRPDTNLLPDVYLMDRVTGCVTRISGSAGAEWWSPSVAPAINGSGQVILFSSSQPVDDDEVVCQLNLFEARWTPARPTR